MDKQKVLVGSHSIGLAGEFRAVLYNSDGSIAQDTGWNSNQIQNRGLLSLGDTQPFQWWSRTWIGSSSGGLPPITQNAIDPGTLLSVNADGPSYVEGPTPSAANGYARSRIMTRRYDAGVGTGTVRQMGLCDDNSAQSLFSVHVLPVPVVKAANQVLDVSYRMTMYPSLTNNVVTGVVIGGVTYTCTSSFYNLLYNGSLNVFNEARVNSGIPAYYNAYPGAAAGLEDSTPSGTAATNGGFGNSYNYLTGSMDWATYYYLNYGNTDTGFVKTSISRMLPAAFRVQTEFAATDGPNIGEGIPKDLRYELYLYRRFSWGRYTP